MCSTMLEFSVHFMILQVALHSALMNTAQILIQEGPYAHCEFHASFTTRH